MLLHAKHISPSISNVVIYTLDTDVFVIVLAASTELLINSFIRTRTRRQARIISIGKVKQSLVLQYDVNNMELAAKAILSLHAFTRCDTTSAFCSRDKVKPLKILRKSIRYLVVFVNIGVDASLGGDVLNVLQDLFVIFMVIKGTATIP